jgi:hydrophobic/amphiphilic exporter-1 (mainly G- bacteria), HAE1 family
LRITASTRATSIAEIGELLPPPNGRANAIAIGSKNAILVVEYARQRRAEGMEIVPAAVDGARLRFRPILIPSFAFILGVFPLVIATGAGAGARRSIGLAVFSGMIASTCLVVVFVPSFYVVM